MNKRGLLFPQSEGEIGVDECARGCGFGSTFVAAVSLPYSVRELQDSEIDDIRDSKKTNEKQRNLLAQWIKKNALSYSVRSATAKEIDQTGISTCIQLQMKGCIEDLQPRKQSIFVDGNYFKYSKEIPVTCIIKGDSSRFTIACASILAKNAHDEYIQSDPGVLPFSDRYCLSSNKGYLTQKHIQSIREHGLTPLHRVSFCSKLFCEENSSPEF